MLRVSIWMSVCALVAAHTQLVCPQSALCKENIAGSNSFAEQEFIVEGHKIIIRYEDSRYLEVECYGWAVLGSEVLPRFNSTIRVPRVTLSKCPPPEAGSFASLLSALNITLLRAGNLSLSSLPPLPQLHARHFVGLESLVGLKLEASIDAWPEPAPGFLRALRSLQSLFVLNVRLPPSELEDPPDSLISLTLRECNMERPPERVFALENLRSLVMDDKRLTNVTASLPPKLQTLVLYSRNTTLQIKSTHALETLSLSNWSGQSTAILHCEALRSLILKRPLVETLPLRWVALCPKLEEVHIFSAHKLTWLPGTLFENATALQHLTLAQGVLETLPVELLDGAPNLRILNLTHNRLRMLPSGMFAAVTALQTLYLSHNSLDADGVKALRGLHSLENLFLGSNPSLGDLCELNGEQPGYSTLIKMEKLKSLILTKTNITSICRDWRENMMYLSTLDLRETQISELRFYDLHYTRNQEEKNAEVLLDGAPVMSIRYFEDDYNRPVQPSAAKVQLGLNVKLECNCHMYWTRLALFPENMKAETRAGVQITGLNCSNGRKLQDMSPEEMRCRVNDVCREAELPPPCECSARPEAGRRASVRVHCDGAGLRALPPLPARADYVYDLVLPNNNISSLRVADLPPNWREVDVRNNSVERVEGATARALVQSPRRLRLAGNPLACGCGAAPLLQALQAAAPPQTDLDSALCADGTPLIQASTAFCATVPMMSWLVPVLVALLAITTGVVAYFTFPEHRKIIKIILWKWGLLPLPPEPPEPEGGFLFDAFLCYPQKDEEIAKQLLQELEQGPKPYRLCLHSRDWVPGLLIANQIEKSMLVSRRTVVLVSQTFFMSDWTQAEFHAAYARTVREVLPRLVVVFLDDPKNLPLNDEMKRYISTNTYVRWGETFFWSNLRRALGNPLNKEINSQPSTERTKSTIRASDSCGTAESLTVSSDVVKKKTLEPKPVHLTVDRETNKSPSTLPLPNYCPSLVVSVAS